jgi:hypothetical protein
MSHFFFNKGIEIIFYGRVFIGIPVYRININ